jgi:SNF2 family DNA or RNA helicase/uncharacterized Zn finger protein
MTVRKTYGNTWWGQQWLNALANIDYSNRLPRGRTYANKGLARDIVIKGNKITANVQGSRPRPYKVAYTVPAFSAKEKQVLVGLVTENPLHLSRLLNRVLPPELKTLCDQKDIDLFPATWEDLEGSCSCPDWAVPCKHMAAVLYLIANEIDKNPFLVFQLHNFDLFQGLAEVGYTAEGQQEIAILSTTSLEQPFNTDYRPSEWDDEVYQQLDFSGIPNLKEDLLTILSENPVFYPRGNFKELLKMAYTAVAKNTSTTLAEATDEDIVLMDRVEHIEILLGGAREFLTATMGDHQGETILVFDEQGALMDWLTQLPASVLPNCSPALKSLVLLYQFAHKLVQQSAYVPQLLRIADSEEYQVRWLPALLNPVVQSLFSGVRSIVDQELLFYRKGKAIFEPTAADNTQALLSFFISALVKDHHKLERRFAEHEIGHLFFNGAVLAFSAYEEKGYPVAIQLWLNKFFLVEKDFVPVIQIDEEEGEGFLVNIAVQKQTERLSTPIPLAKVLAQKQYQNLRMEVLRDLAMLADYFPQINRLVANHGKESLFFDAEAFVEVLFKVLPTIRLFGIKVLLPKALRKLFRPQMSMLVTSEEESGVVAKSTLLNIEEMLSFQWRIALGDQQITVKEFKQLVKQLSGIVKLNDQYVFFDENEIKSLINKLENPPILDSRQLLQIALTEDYEGAKVALDAKTQQLMKRLLEGEEVDLPKGLQAQLRPYQLSGYEWMYKNCRIGFGSLIADDMGLGKTLQVIAVLLRLKEDGELAKQKALIIVPTTLLTNWEKEIARFAPTLGTHIYHGSNRSLEPLEEADVLLTTYGVARSETAVLQKKKWLILVIDEAQNIKNPATSQTKAIKKIQAPVKIAMSGTPVENRLSEYWSIFDFSNKGYLDSLKNFKEEYAKPIEIERDREKLEKFRKVTEPFILRRLKSDRSIIKDLPEKVEKDQFCQLSPVQTALYKNVVDTTMETIEKTEGIERKGLVLKLITALKQVCNHPRQFLKKGDLSPADSGKMQMLFNLLHEIQQSGEKTLIFTQYQEMGNLLVSMLEAEFGLTIPFLHGGVSRKGRDEMVDRFQNDRATRIMILSLKAGGTGLNLTAASNVIHYDLWWNPAVEAQATDRAYRIGQKRNVMVHRFITEHTFEEKINMLLQEKKELANLTVSTGEKWIGEYSNEELRELVKLD